jgi:NAD(P)-dependent dehydrogenase (short-subunit alcohol dehydrogenase family)
MFDLSSKHVLITGGLGGIAESIVQTLLSARARVTVSDLVDPESASEALRARYGDQAADIHYRIMDVTNADQVESVFSAMADQPPNVVIGNAGGCPLHPFIETPQAEFDRIFALNFTAQTYVARATVTLWLRKRIPGSLIFISSWVARYPYPGTPAYASAKAALELFARSLALEVSYAGIHVNCVAPGIVAAGSAKRIYDSDAEYRAQINGISPFKRLGTPESVAGSVAFLCSEYGEDFQGQVLGPDAGVSLPQIVRAADQEDRTET